MADTKEKILHTALRLFAREGYEATSVGDIAGELGLTKGALYKHYRNKRDIFESIVARMYQIDVAKAKEYEVPEETFERAPSAYRRTTPEQLRAFTEAQFHFWTEEAFGCHFRQMLTLEQYRSPEMMTLYQQCLLSGPVAYLEDLFREMTAQGVWQEGSPKQMALEFYAPFYLLIGLSDDMTDKGEAARMLAAHAARWIDRYAAREENKETGTP
ncbi:MAG: helix-turn-helix domain-containing protein [Eubacteriales bacterium]